MVVAALTGGCFRPVFDGGTPSTLSLPLPPMPSDAVAIEVCTFLLPESELAAAEACWGEIDEQNLPAELRRRLAANGLRCGLIGGQVPAAWQKLLATSPAGEKPPPAAQPGQEATTRVDNGPANEIRLMQIRGGRPTEILTTPVRPQITLLERVNDSLRGARLTQAQGVLVTRVFPQGDGRARLEIVPEVQHGEPKQRFVGKDGVFQMENARDRRRFEDLRMEMVLAPGQTLAIGSSSESKGVGDALFREREQNPGRKVVLIRLAQTQYDDLFAPERVSAPVATSQD